MFPHPRTTPSPSPPKKRAKLPKYLPDIAVLCEGAEQFRIRYPNVRLYRTVISTVVTRFRETVYRDKTKLGRPSALAAENREDVRWCNSLQGKVPENLHRTPVNQRAVRKFHLCPYCIRAVQKLKGPGTAKRLQYCKRFRSFVEETIVNKLDIVYFSDEAFLVPP